MNMAARDFFFCTSEYYWSKKRVIGVIPYFMAVFGSFVTQVLKTLTIFSTLQFVLVLYP